MKGKYDNALFMEHYTQSWKSVKIHTKKSVFKDKLKNYRQWRDATTYDAFLDGDFIDEAQAEHAMHFHLIH